MASSAQDIPSTAYKPPVANGGLDPVTVVRVPQSGDSHASGSEVGGHVSASALGRLFPVEEQRASQADLPAGLKLGQYIIESRIGAGGMGAVFKARDEQLDRLVALKILSPSQSSDPSSVRRFQNEARAAARLDHDNIARIYAVGESHGLNYIAFEYVEGITVRELIRQRGGVDSQQTINFMLQISMALKHTAAAGVVHRDIKPSNLILTPQGRAKLVDWGLARKERLDENSLDLTVSGTTLGTFDYISPEQARDPRNVDVRSDIYSLGCTAYHMLTGSPPYAEGTVLQKLLDHQGKNAPDPRDRNPDVPRELSRIVRKMMASNPEDRYWSPQALTHDLLMLASESGLRPVHPDGLTWRSETETASGRLPGTIFWWWLGAFTLACLLAIAGDRWVVSRDVPLQATWPPQPAGGGDSLPYSSFSGLQNTQILDREKSHSLAELPAPNLTIEPGKEPPLFPPLGFSENSQVNIGEIPPPLTGEMHASKLRVESPPPWAFPGGDAGWDESDFPEREPGLLAIDIQKELQLASMGTSSTPSAGTENPAVFPPPQEQLSFRILAANGEFLQNIGELEAALQAVPDGGVIEFQAVEGKTSAIRLSPVRVVDKAVTLRSTGTASLILRCDTSALDASARSSEFITIKGGALTLSNLHLQVVVAGPLSQSWSLFAIEGAGRLRCQQSTITLDSQVQSTAAVVRLNRSPMQAVDSMGKDNGGEEILRRVQFDDCVIRGTADVLLAETSEATSVEIMRTLITVDGALLRYLGDNNLRHPYSSFDVRLARVAGVFNDGVLRGDLGVSIPRQPVDVRFRVEDSILLGLTGQPLMQLSASLENRALQALLFWDGEHNLYGGWDRYVSIRGQASPDAAVTSLDFEAWARGSGSIREVNPRLQKAISLVETDRRFDQWTAGKYVSLLQSDGPDRLVPADLAEYGPDFLDLPVPPPLIDAGPGVVAP